MRALLLVAVCTVAVPDREDPTPKKPVPPAEQILGHGRFATTPGTVTILMHLKRLKK